MWSDTNTNALKKKFWKQFLKSELEVHLNLRIGVKFKEKMQDREGLMFTRQIQEYLEWCFNYAHKL